MNGDSIYDQHKMTALMLDRKTRYKSQSSKSHFHHKDTDAQLMQRVHVDPWYQGKKKNKESSLVKYFNFRQTKENFVFCVP